MTHVVKHGCRPERNVTFISCQGNMLIWWLYSGLGTFNRGWTPIGQIFDVETWNYIYMKLWHQGPDMFWPMPHPRKNIRERTDFYWMPARINTPSVPRVPIFFKLWVPSRKIRIELKVILLSSPFPSISRRGNICRRCGRIEFWPKQWAYRWSMLWHFTA